MIIVFLLVVYPIHLVLTINCRHYYLIGDIKQRPAVYSLSSKGLIFRFRRQQTLSMWHCQPVEWLVVVQQHMVQAYSALLWYAVSAANVISLSIFKYRWLDDSSLPSTVKVSVCFGISSCSPFSTSFAATLFSSPAAMLDYRKLWRTCCHLASKVDETKWTFIIVAQPGGKNERLAKIIIAIVFSRPAAWLLLPWRQLNGRGSGLISPLHNADEACTGSPIG